MAIAHTSQIVTPYDQMEEHVQVNIESLLLAMITSFDTEISERTLFKHINNLFKELNLVIPDELEFEVPKSLKLLTAYDYLIQEDDQFVITEEGKTIGQRALINFQNDVLEFL